MTLPFKLGAAAFSSLIVALFVGPGCGSGSSGDGGAGGGAAGHASSDGGAAGAGGTSGAGTKNNPQSGCLDGYVVCGEVCAHLEDDGRNCGTCHHVCDADVSEGCVKGVCTPHQVCSAPFAICGGICTNPENDADNCGSCKNACADTELCASIDTINNFGTCVAVDGAGTSCRSPIVLDGSVREGAGFRMASDLTVPHKFSCGPLEALPTRWFRIIANNDRSVITVGTDMGDDYILELYSAATCTAPSSVACQDDPNEANGVEVELSDVVTTPGEPYFLAVGIKGKWSGRPAILTF